MEVIKKHKNVTSNGETSGDDQKQLSLHQNSLKPKQKAKENNVQQRQTHYNKQNMQYYDSSDSGSQVSFEQDLLEEHLAIIIQKIETYQIFTLNKSLQDQEKLFTMKAPSLQEHLSRMLFKLRPHSPSLARSFFQYLQKNSPFRDYLRQIYYNIQSKKASLIIKYVFFIWNIYVPCDTMCLNLDELQEIAIVISKNLSQKLAVECQHKNEEERKWIYRFCFILTTTTILVIQKIFKNPFFRSSESENSKEQQINESGRKRVNYTSSLYDSVSI